MKKLFSFLTASAAALALTAAVHADAPVIQFSFDEENASGSYTDTVSGKTIVGTGTTVVDGVLGKALYFDGKTSFASVENFDILTDDAARTVITWVKIAPEDMRQTASILAYGGESEDGDVSQTIWKTALGGENGGLWQSAANDYNYFRFPVDKGNSEAFWDGFALHDDGIWHQIAVTYDGEVSMKMYVDGRQAAVCDNAYIFTAPSSVLYLGASGYKDTPDEFFRGAIDEVSFHDYAMTAEQILASYHEVRSAASASAFAAPFAAGLGYDLVSAVVEQDWFTADNFPFETTIDRYIRANTPAGTNPFWHTQWEDEALIADFEPPIDVYVELAEKQEIGGIGLFPRQDGSHGGKIISCEVYVSEDNIKWTFGGSASGFIVDPENPETHTKKVVTFDQPVTGKYVHIKLTELRSTFGSLNEIFVYAPAAKAAVEEPAAQTPVVEEPTVEEPVVEEPIAEEPAAEVPAEESVQTAPQTFDVVLLAVFAAAASLAACAASKKRR